VIAAAAEVDAVEGALGFVDEVGVENAREGVALGVQVALADAGVALAALWTRFVDGDGGLGVATLMHLLRLLPLPELQTGLDRLVLGLAPADAACKGSAASAIAYSPAAGLLCFKRIPLQVEGEIGGITLESRSRRAKAASCLSMKDMAGVRRRGEGGIGTW
jgi:hypothetical protein